ncbi:hypothetical protein SCHPADRAFT_826222 [Schizopora paradoxa]|uniref:Uncharacterized protein n=1 Tax=Schizopora paradoxa TaxID=27342 RepID=A0A0H2RSI9_9AGAM|nr:hypothetical protein SCHPADRAFT_826222 [Schizopora paradoxa]
MPYSTASSSSDGERRSYANIPLSPPVPDGRIPVTPAVLRSIFASSRTEKEERSISRKAFFRFAGFILSCIGISLAASRSRAMKTSAALLGVV